MTHTEPGPLGALDWTRRLRVGEARLVAGGFLTAGPNVHRRIPHAMRTARVASTRRPDPSLRGELSM